MSAQNNYLPVTGMKPSPPDERDFRLFKIMKLQTPKPSVRVDHLVPYVPDQGRCGTCVGFGSMSMMHVDTKRRRTYPDKGLSALYLYAKCKQEDGFPNEEGTYPRIAAKVLQRDGICPETDLPYSRLNQNACTVMPTISPALDTLAANRKIKAYARIHTLQELKLALTAGKMVGLGLLVTDSFAQPKPGGFINTPDGNLYGWHWVMATGYDDNLKNPFTGKAGNVRILNSWNTTWGDKGFGWLSYDFMNWHDGFPAVAEMWAYEYEPIPEDVQYRTIRMWIDNPEAEVDGQIVPIDPQRTQVTPVIIGGNDGRTMVPLRFVADAFGATVFWDNFNKVAVINQKDRVIRLALGSNVANVNGTEVTLDVPMQMIQDRVLVPIRFVGEAMKHSVQWFADKRMVVITN